MHAEYKRDMNHNYLVLHGEEIDTSSYQVRMLVGNIIPSLLKCRIQGIDGKFAVYYDITSRQSLSSFYENKKIGHEDLRVIFGEFIRVMEDASEYLMNPGQIVLMPDYMFLEVEKREIYFCFLPGYQKDMKKQFQELIEYILPKIDHEDEMAVRIGYGIYRRALDDGFHLEHMKEELFRGRELEVQKEDMVSSELKIKKTELLAAKTDTLEEDFAVHQEEFWRRNEAREHIMKVGQSNGREKTGMDKNYNKILKSVIVMTVICFVFAAVLIFRMEGYLSEVEVFTILGLVIICMVSGMLFSILAKKIKRKKERKYETAEQISRRTEGNENDRVTEWECGSFISEVETERMISSEEAVRNCGETVVLSMSVSEGSASLVSREPGELATIYLEKDLTVIGKLETASDAVINLPTVSRVHAKIRKRDGEYYLTDLNSRNGTTVNGRLLKTEEEYCLQNEDEVDFAQARYIFLGR